jgi:hypothetical protein
MAMEMAAAAGREKAGVVIPSVFWEEQALLRRLLA